MTLGLHSKCKERLVGSIAEQLLKVEVRNKIFIEYNSCIGLLKSESSLPSGAIRSKLSEFIGELPLYDFVVGTISRELKRNVGYDSADSLCKLSDIEGYSNLQNVAKDLVEKFDSLPWNYTFTIELGDDISAIFHENINDFKISENMMIRKLDNHFTASYPPMFGIEKRDSAISGNGFGTGLLSYASQQYWNPKGAFLQISSNGFVGQFSNGEIIVSAEERIKSFCGLGIALRLFKIDSKYRSTPTKAKFYSHQFENESWYALDKHELDYHDSDTFHDLVLHDLDGKLDSQESFAKWGVRKLKEIQTVFSSENKDKSHKLLLACQWLFESFSGKNELLSFVQTAVVIEILLGDKASSKEVGLGTLLQNRCAYLIGASQTERDEILSDFQEIYDVRSKIVHSGKSRLNYVEKTLLYKLQWMCRRVIQEEVKLLRKDEDREM